MPQYAKMNAAYGHTATKLRNRLVKELGVDKVNILVKDHYYYISGFVNTSKGWVYIFTGDFRFSPGTIYFRRAKGPTDYTGESNQSTTWATLTQDIRDFMRL